MSYQTHTVTWYVVPALKSDGYFSTVFEAWSKDPETPQDILHRLVDAFFNRLDVHESPMLAESGEETTIEPVGGNWELISLNAAPMEGEVPIDPTTLMHNHFGSSGGSATGLGDEAFVKQLRESFIWWRDKAMSSK